MPGVTRRCCGDTDVRNNGAKRVAKKQTGLALTDESLEHAFSKVVAHGCVLDLAEGNESGVVVEKVTIGFSKGAVVFHKTVAEVTLSSFLHGLHQGQGVLAVVGEPRGGRQVFNSGVSIIAKDLSVSLLKKCSGVRESVSKLAEFAHDVAIAIGHDNWVGRALGQ